MSLLRRLAAPLKTAADAFFKHDIAVRRGEGGLRVVLVAPDAPAPLPSAAERAAAEQARQLQSMREELAQVLDEDASLRHTARHLAFVEQALALQGVNALYEVPLEVLKTALGQFEGMVTNWSPPGLACLRSKMAVAVHEREGPASPGRASQAPAALAARAIETARTAEVDPVLAAAYAKLGVPLENPPRELAQPPQD
jgi:hypothetical protein